MLKVQYSLKKGFVSAPAFLVVEENQVSPEDYVLLKEHSQNLGFGNAKQEIVRLPVAKLYQGFGLPYVSTTDFVSENPIVVSQAIEVLKTYVADKARLEAELPAIVETYKAEHEAKELALAEAKRIAAEEKAIAYAEKLASAAIIEWNAENKAILNLHERLAILSELEFDSRFNNWIKRVDSINKAKENGYCFEGTWINDRTIEIENANMVFIVAGTSGSRKYATTHYRVMVLRDGKLEATDISADNNDAGWALLIRDKVAELLK